MNANSPIFFYNGTLLKVIMAVIVIGQSIAADAQITRSSHPPQALNLPACGESFSLAGQNSQTVSIQSGAEPGATDPMRVPAGRYTFLPDHGVLAFTPTGTSVDAKYYTTDTNANLKLNNPTTLQSSPWDPDGDGPTPVFAASGHFLTPDHDDVAVVTRFGKAAQTSKVSIRFVGTDGSTVLPENLSPRQADSSDFIAVTHADLDQAVDAHGNLHDELIVAHLESQTKDANGTPLFVYSLDVLNYGSSNKTAPDVSHIHFVSSAPRFTTDGTNAAGVLASGNILSVVTGDFDGNGHTEIAVASLGDQMLVLSTYRYETSGRDRSLRQVGSETWPIGNNFSIITASMGKASLVGSLAMTAGDFNGDGKDELVIAYAKWQKSGSEFTYGTGALLFQYDQILHASPKSTGYFADSYETASTYAATRPRVDLAQGQFLFNPPQYGRHQLAMAYKYGHVAPNYDFYPVRVVAFSVDDNLSGVKEFGRFETPFSPLQTMFGIPQFNLVAGGFQGGSNPNPVQSLALAATMPDGGNSSYHVFTLKLDGTNITIADQVQTRLKGMVGTGLQFPVVAYDRPGKSVYLGKPVHIVMQNNPETDYIMQEPPKHAYWDERAHKIMNFSRLDGNNVHLYNSSGSSISTSSTDTSARATGGSLAVSAGFTVGVGGSFMIGQAKSEVSADVQLRGSYDYNENKEKFNSGYRSRTVTSEAKTDRDDYLVGRLQMIDIWRYRIYRTPTGSSNSFYEMVMPGVTTPIQAGGMQVSWYQPVHENGNILSYPVLPPVKAAGFIPPDMGSYTLLDGRVETKPQLPASLYYFGGNSGSTTLNYSNEVSEGGSFTYSHEIAESLDIRGSVTSTAEVPGLNVETRICGSVEAHNSNSWGNSSIENRTSKTENAVTLNRTPTSAVESYPFYPVLYNTKDGTMKMSFWISNPGDKGNNATGAAKFSELYGVLPDPALNLPLRFVSQSAGSGELEQWTPNLTTERKSMRGLFFRKAERNAVTNTFDLLGLAPQDGDKVRIEARVYNYSTAKAAGSTKVDFWVIPYDSEGNNEICDNPINTRAGAGGGLICPASARTKVGSTTVPALNPMQFSCMDGMDDPATTGCAASSTYIDWNTTGFGGEGFGTREYRVYVVLTPSGAEKYGSDGKTLAITHVENTTPLLVTAPGSDMETGEYAIIGGVRGLDAANGTFQVTRRGPDTFELNGTDLSRGHYEGGGTTTQLDPGQNDEGFGFISVTARAALQVHSEGKVPHDYLAEDALRSSGSGMASALNPSPAVTAHANEPLQLRFKAHSSIVHTDAAHMLLFDGDPASGGAAIADQMIHPGLHGPDGTSVWLKWTPTELGPHHLYAVLVEGPGGQNPMATLDVEVVAGKCK